jgi:thiamine-phosphate pyrophosphorylase
MKLIVVTPSKNVPDEESIVTRMFESGLQTLHIRKPNYSTQAIKDYLNEIPAHFHNRIVLHSHHKLALKYNLKGIHLTSSHLTKKWKYWFISLRLTLKLSKRTKSRSYNRLQQAYQKEEHPFNYYLMGTMFNGFTNELYSGFYHDGVVAAIKNADKNFVARGGTTPASVLKAYQLKFYGIAFNSFIWKSDTPTTQFDKVLATFKEHNIELE